MCLPAWLLADFTATGSAAKLQKHLCPKCAIGTVPYSGIPLYFLTREEMSTEVRLSILDVYATHIKLDEVDAGCPSLLECYTEGYRIFSNKVPTVTLQMSLLSVVLFLLEKAPWQVFDAQLPSRFFTECTFAPSICAAVAAASRLLAQHINAAVPVSALGEIVVSYMHDSGPKSLLSRSLASH